MDKVTLKNISSARVIISLPDSRFLRRDLMPGRSVAVEREEYDELMNDPGFDGLLKDHYIRVSGLEEEDIVATSAENTALDVSEISKMLDSLDVTAFAKFIPHAAQAEKDTVVKLAVEKNIVHPAFVKLIQQYCDVDIMNAINVQHQLQ